MLSGIPLHSLNPLTLLYIAVVSKLLRWLKTATTIACVYIKHEKSADYIWRRIQTSDQQAERQKKSVVQLCITFHGRADAIRQD